MVLNTECVVQVKKKKILERTLQYIFLTHVILNFRLLKVKFSNNISYLYKY